MKLKTIIALNQAGAVAIVLCIILVGFGTYEGGAAYGATTVTVASTTITRTLSLTSTITSTFNITSLAVRTVKEYSVVTDTGPASVLLLGTVKTTTPGTSPTQISFLSVLKNQTFNAQVLNGQYTITLPTHDIYDVYISFGTVTGNVGAGRCLAGAFVIWSGFQPMPAANWVC